MELNEVTNGLWSKYVESQFDVVFIETKKWFNRKANVNDKQLLFLLSISNVSNKSIGSRLFWKYFIFGHRYDIFGNKIYKNIRKDFSDRWEELIYEDYQDVSSFWSVFYKELEWKKTYPKQKDIGLFVKGHKWDNYLKFIGNIEKVELKEYYSNLKFYIEDFEKDERFISGRFTYESSSIYFAKECLTFHLKNTLDKTIDEFIDNGKIEIIKGKWISEYNLYLEIKNHLNNFSVIHQGSPSFLSGQRFDIWIPELKTAIEYNGIQHYEPVNIFGGVKGFNNTVARDKMKKKKCKINNIKLIEVQEGYDIKKIILDIEERI